MFSVIMPTMWMSDKTSCMIVELSKSKLIDEIIIIDNNPEKSIKLDNLSGKFKIIKNKENIYVNPSWNLGVKMSKNNNLIITNDDLCIKNIDKVLDKIQSSEFDLIGLDLVNLNKDSQVMIKSKTGEMEKGFGCFFYVKKSKFVPIDNEIKIWYGGLIFNNIINNKGVMSFGDIDFELSKTVKSTNNLSEILKNDKNVYQRKYKNRY